MLSLLDDQTRREVKGLLDYAEDEAGGLMNTRYSRLRADMTVDEAISYLRKDARMREKRFTTFLSSMLKNICTAWSHSEICSFLRVTNLSKT